MTIGEWIKHCRSARGMTQKDFATALGVTAVYLSYLENDKKTPSVQLLRNVATLCRVEFFTKEQDNE